MTCVSPPECLYNTYHTGFTSANHCFGEEKGGVSGKLHSFNKFGHQTRDTFSDCYVISTDGRQIILPIVLPFVYLIKLISVKSVDLYWTKLPWNNNKIDFLVLTRENSQCLLTYYPWQLERITITYEITL